MGRGLVAAVAAGILGWSGIASAGNQKDRPTHPAAQAALRYFESVLAARKAGTDDSVWKEF